MIAKKNILIPDKHTVTKPNQAVKAPVGLSEIATKHEITPRYNITSLNLQMVMIDKPGNSERRPVT